MTTYDYKAKKGPKEIVEGQIQADSEESASGRLIEMGLFPISVIERQETRKALPEAEVSKIKVRTPDVDIFTSQLSSLVRSSVPILRALSLISDQTQNKALKSVIENLSFRVKEGQSLSEAMSAYPRVFNHLYLNLVKSGERSGALEQVLTALADHREKDQEFRQKIQVAFAYPSLLIIVGVASIFSMFAFFLPKLMTLFEGMKQTLPLPTRILLGISRFTSAHWLWFLVPLLFLIFYLSRIERGTPKKYRLDSLILRIPFFGKLSQDAEIAKFCRTMALLFNHGIIIHEGLDLAAGTVDNDVLRGQLEEVGREIVEKGTTLSDSLAKLERFPKFAINMIAVGEEAGKLDDSLQEIAKVYERGSDHAIKIMTSLMEPILILIIGLFVLFIVFAMMLPIFSMGTI